MTIGFPTARTYDSLLPARGANGGPSSASPDGRLRPEKGSREVPVQGGEECQTCKNRKYQDGSDDPGVSFKTAAKLRPEQAATAVRGHEQQHVSREQAKAKREGREVVSQSVSYQTGICPECQEVYVSGGTTRTVTKAGQEPERPGEELGKYVDLYA